MARGSKTPQNTDDSQEEMTVVIFKLKGGSGTLQKGFEAISTAFASFGAPTIPQTSSRKLGNGSGARTILPPDNSEDQSQEDDSSDEATQVIEGQPAKARSSNGITPNSSSWTIST